MEKGINKYWTPGNEAYFQRALTGAKTFAERYMVTLTGNVLKYDGRTREAKKATARLQLMLATASDDDLVALAELEHQKDGSPSHPNTDERLEELVALRDKVKSRGIPRDLIARGKDA